jgi:hypothetical protein
MRLVMVVAYFFGMIVGTLMEFYINSMGTELFLMQQAPCVLKLAVCFKLRSGAAGQPDLMIW